VSPLPDDANGESAAALLRKTLALRDGGQVDEALVTCDTLFMRFGRSEDQASRERAAKAVYLKAELLTELGRHDEAVSTYELLEATFSGRDGVTVASILAVGVDHHASALRTLGRYQEAIALYDLLVAQFGSSRDENARRLVLVALDSKAQVLEVLGDYEAAIASYDRALRKARFGKTAAMTRTRCLEQRGRLLAKLGRTREGLASFDKALGILDRLDRDRPQPMRIHVLYEKARAQLEGREAEAVVLFDVLVATYKNFSIEERVPEMTELLAAALFWKTHALAALGRETDIDDVSRQMATALGDVTYSPAAQPSQVADAGDAQLAGLLADTLAGDCWFEFATADQKPATRELMTKRALAIYAQTDRYIGAPPQDERSTVAALFLRSIADGYALLSFPWDPSERATLSLPTRKHSEWVVRQAGLDQWATEDGRPLEVGEQDEWVEGVLSDQRSNMFERPNAVDGQRGHCVHGGGWQLRTVPHARELRTRTASPEWGRRPNVRAHPDLIREVVHDVGCPNPRRGRWGHNHDDPHGRSIVRDFSPRSRVNDQRGPRSRRPQGTPAANGWAGVATTPRGSTARMAAQR
jgi:tetratricopeptide (TPR) repeat protein